MRLTRVANAHSMDAPFDVQAPKKATNVSINTDLLAKARALKINLSATLETALAERVSESERWKRENAAAIAAYNRWVQEHGSLGDALKRF